MTSSGSVYFGFVSHVIPRHAHSDRAEGRQPRGQAVPSAVSSEHVENPSHNASGYRVSTCGQCF